MLKSYGWWVVVVAWRNLVSAQGPLVLGLGLRVWGQGLTKKGNKEFGLWTVNKIFLARSNMDQSE